MGTERERALGEGLSKSWQLAEIIASEFQVESDGDLRKVASVAAKYRGEAAVKRFVAEEIVSRSRRPLAAHRALARVRPPLVVTTNYDDLCERGLEEVVGERPARIRRQEDLVHLSKGKSRVVKLHGDAEDYISLVLTGPDYLDWEKNVEALFADVTAEFQRSSCVFVGYSLSDENLRRIIGLVRGRLGRYAPKHYALVHKIDEGTAAEFGDSVEFVEGDATEFLEGLAERWEREAPGPFDLRAEERRLSESLTERNLEEAARSCGRLQEDYLRRGATNIAATNRTRLAILADGIGQNAAAAEAYAEAGRLYLEAGAETWAEEASEKALECARAAGLPAQERRIEKLLRDTRLSGGDYDAVIDETEGALSDLEEGASPEVLYALYSARSRAKEAMGDERGASSEIRTALGAIEDEALYQRTWLRADLARVLAGMLDWGGAVAVLDDAETEIRRAPASVEDEEKGRAQALVDVVKANLHQARGEEEEAARLYRRCAETLEDVGDAPLLVSALQGAIYCARLLGRPVDPTERAREADYYNTSLEYRRLRDKLREGIVELVTDRLAGANANISQALTAAKAVHNPFRERIVRNWHAKVLEQAGESAWAMREYVLAGDAKGSAELASRLALSISAADRAFDELVDELLRFASEGSMLSRKAAFAALASLADVLPARVLPALADVLSELDGLPGSLLNDRNILQEAAKLAAAVMPVLNDAGALRVGRALVRAIRRTDLFWTGHERACIALGALATQHPGVVDELEIPVERLGELVESDVINDRHKALRALVLLAIAGHGDAGRKAGEILRAGDTIHHVRWRAAIGDADDAEIAAAVRAALPRCAARVRPIEDGIELAEGDLSPAFIQGWKLPEEVCLEATQVLTSAAAAPMVMPRHRQEAVLVIGQKAQEFADGAHERAIEALMNLLTQGVDMHPSLQALAGTSHPLSAFKIGTMGSAEEVRAQAAGSLLALSPWMGRRRRQRLMHEIETLRASQLDLFGRRVAEGLRHFRPRSTKERAWLSTRLLLLLNAPYPTVRGLTARSLGTLVEAGALPFDAELLDILLVLGSSGSVEDRVGAAHALARVVGNEEWDRPTAGELLERLRADASHSVRRSAS